MSNGTPSYSKLYASLNNNIEKTSSLMSSSEESKRERRAVAVCKNAIQNVCKFFYYERGGSACQRADGRGFGNPCGR
jgi:galactokinase